MPTPYDSRWQAVRIVVLHRDNYLCTLHLPGCTTTADAVDHIVPLNEGGARLDPVNLRAACIHCNSRRGRLRQIELARHALTSTNVGQPSRNW